MQRPITPTVPLTTLASFASSCPPRPADAKYLAVATKDNAVLLFHVRVRAHIHIELEAAFSPHARVRCMTFGARDEALVLGTSRAIVYVLARQDLAIVHVIHSPHRDEVVAVAVSADGQLLATGCKDKHARVFDLAVLASPEEEAQPSNLIYSVERDRVYALAFSPMNDFLLIGADDKRIQLIEPRLGICVYTIDVFTDYVRAVCFFNSGRTFMAASKNGVMSMFDFDSGEEVRRS